MIQCQAVPEPIDLFVFFRERGCGRQSPTRLPLTSMTDYDVIIPTKDRAELTIRALQTVRSQYHRPRKTIIVDDGSTPEQRELLRAGLGSDELLLVNDSSLGVSAARNRGLDASAADAVLFLDSDDLWLPGHSTGVLAALRSGSGLCVAGSVTVAAPTSFRRRNRVSVAGPARHSSIDLCGVAGATTVLSGQASLTAGSCIGLGRQALNARLRFDECLEVMEDADLVVQGLVSGSRVTFVQAVTVIRDAGPHSHLYQAERALRSFVAMTAKWVDRVPFSPATCRRILVQQLRLAALSESEVTTSVNVPWEVDGLERLLVRGSASIQRHLGSGALNQLLRGVQHLPGW